MKQFIILALMIGITTSLLAQNHSKEVEALLKKMTLEEKIGQMTQVTIGAVGNGKEGETDPVKLKEAIQKYHIGSILNVDQHAMSVAEWHRMLTAIQDEAMKSRLKIPIIYGLDAIHGQTYTLESTLFPQNIAIAASRNIGIARKVAKITAAELRASGVRWNFGPMLDCGRQVYWSRFPESYGEDTYIGKVMGSAAVKGYEEDGLGKTTSVASCMKHYMGYSNPRNGKDRTPAYIPEIELREHYLPQFREAVASGASSVMINSSLINGVPTHGDKYLLTDVLRKELGFKGVAVSDWEDIKRLYTWHKVASSPLDAVIIGVNAGVDMSMVPYDFSFATLLLEAVNKKLVSMERIDEAVRRILTMKYNVGLFSNPYPEKEAMAQFGKPEYKDYAYEAAAEAMTLLKNTKNILPLKPGLKLLVAGPSAQSKAALNGAWSYTWQGKDEKWYPESEMTILEAFQQKLGSENVITTSGQGYDNPANLDVRALRDAAQNVDVVVLCLGENAYAESPGNIFALDMPTEQKELIRAAKSSGKPVIVVLNQGRPLFITDMVNEMDAILLAYWSGSGGAKAIVSTIMGDNNPSGILPFSYPKYPGDIVLYDHIFTETIREVFNNNVGTGYDPLFPFGFGLSYTTFEYSDLKLSDNKMSVYTTIKVSVTIQNTGTRQGKHSVELYTHDQYATIAPSVRRLRAFQKIDLKPGEKQTITFELKPEDIEFVNAQLKRVTEPGEFDVMIGELKGTFKYR